MKNNKEKKEQTHFDDIDTFATKMAEMMVSEYQDMGDFVKSKAQLKQQEIF